MSNEDDDTITPENMKVAFLERLQHTAFLQGFVAGREPKNPRDTLLACEAAERAYLEYHEQQSKVDK